MIGKHIGVKAVAAGPRILNGYPLAGTVAANVLLRLDHEF
tara:strand:- start:10506 stop:10625 length:120 start_codon:yes stop_codon:yes gene_type:complete